MFRCPCVTETNANGHDGMEDSLTTATTTTKKKKLFSIGREGLANFHGQNSLSPHAVTHPTNDAYALQMWQHLKREILRLSTGVRVIVKKYCYNKGRIYQAQMF